jgi:hypothetical protein
MILDLKIIDKGKKVRGESRLRLDFEKSRWSIPAGPDQDAWNAIGPSKEGWFERQANGVIWIWDQKPGERNTVILWNPPASETDYEHPKGSGCLFAPTKTEFKDFTVDWNVDQASRLTGGRARQTVLKIVKEELIIPAARPRVGDGTPMIHSKEDAATFINWAQISHEMLLAKWNKQVPYTTCYNFVGKVLKMASDKLGVKMPHLEPPKMYKASGWNKWLPGINAEYPQPGDFFQLGTNLELTLHAGVIIDFDGKQYTRAEAGQGGPNYHWDAIKKNVGAIQGASDKRPFLGWVNVDQLFAGPMPETRK